MDRGRDHWQRTKALANPDPQHIQLQEGVVDSLAPVHVHEQVVEEAAAPRSDRPHDVTPGQEPVIIPHQLGRDSRQNIYNRNSYGGDRSEKVFGWRCQSSSLTVGQYVKRLVVEIEEAGQTPRYGLQRPVSGEDVGVEL